MTVPVSHSIRDVSQDHSFCNYFSNPELFPARVQGEALKHSNDLETGDNFEVVKDLKAVVWSTSIPRIVLIKKHSNGLETGHNLRSGEGFKSSGLVNKY